MNRRNFLGALAATPVALATIKAVEPTDRKGWFRIVIEAGGTRVDMTVDGRKLVEMMQPHL